MRRASRRAALASVTGAVMLVASGCASGGAAASSPATSIESSEFAPILAVDLQQFTRHGSGIYVNDVVRGDGVIAVEGRKVTFRYSASLADGSVVDIQREPIEQELGSAMIRGMRIGLAGMRAGGQRRIIVPPSLAYGRNRYGKVPPNSILVFDLDLVSVR